MRIEWAARLGLTETAMSGPGDRMGGHKMLLDGVARSFGLSTVDRLDEAGATRDWAWSSGVLHHVSETEDEVMVQRWDASEPTTFRPGSVRDNLDSSYETLTRDHVEASMGVTEHAINAFRRLRSHFGAEEGETALSVYLLFLAALLEGRDRSPLDDPAQVAQLYMTPAETCSGRKR